MALVAAALAIMAGCGPRIERFYDEDLGIVCYSDGWNLKCFEVGYDEPEPDDIYQQARERITG